MTTASKLTVRDMDTEDLQKELEDLNNSIEDFDCFGTSDILRREEILDELFERGIEV